MLAKSAGKHSEFFLASWSAFFKRDFLNNLQSYSFNFFCLIFVQGVFITQYKLWGGEKLGDNFVFEALEAQHFFTYFQKKLRKFHCFLRKFDFPKSFCYVIFFISFLRMKNHSSAQFFDSFSKKPNFFFFKFVNTPGLFSCFCLHCSAVCLRSTSHHFYFFSC